MWGGRPRPPLSSVVSRRSSARQLDGKGRDNLPALSWDGVSVVGRLSLVVSKNHVGGHPCPPSRVQLDSSVESGDDQIKRASPLPDLGCEVVDQVHGR